MPAYSAVHLDDSVLEMTLREAREVFEREYLRLQLHRSGGNVARAARVIDMQRTALHRKARCLGISADEFRCGIA